MIPRIKAAMMPIAPAAMPKVLAIPPRFTGEKEMTTPRIPKMMATTASPIAPVAVFAMKLQMAAMTATIDGMLKELRVTGVVVAISHR